MPRNCANSYGYRNVVPVPRLHKVRQLMLKRPFKSLIARIAIVALALSLVVPFVPAAFAQDTSIDYAENGTGPVATFTAIDADGDAIVWSLSGADAEDFTIEGGVLAFKKSPNYESPKDQGNDNTYNVALNASGGSRDVSVTVTNVDETGTVSLNDLQPQSGESVGASVSDQDSSSLDQITWQWSKSMDEAAWEDISGATSPTYTPKTGDIGYFLRATTSYSDGLGTGRDSASGVTAFAVEERPVSNAQPAFEDTGDADGAQQSRSVRETAEVGDSVGNAVTASDSDNDPLLYTLSDSTAQSTTNDETGGADTIPDDRDGDSTRFKIDRKTGQITTAETMPDQDTDGTASSYVVTVTATDPSGSMNTVEVTITIVDVDEAPEISLADTGLDTAFTLTRTGDEFVVTTPEEAALALAGEGNVDNTFATLLPVFDATDPEEEGSSPNVDKITWSISGPDVKRFEIAKVVGTDGTTSAPNSPANSSAALRWSSSDKSGPSYEDQDSADGDNVYEVTVTAFDGTSSKSQPVSVTVNNVEEIGAVSLTQLVPQTGIAVTAKLNDPDGGVTGASWQWYRGGTKAATTTATAADDDADIAGAVTIDPATINPCADTNTDAICSIPDATSSTYTPTDDDDGNLLTAWVTYTDALGDETNTARATSESNARERRDANAAPSFGDDESVERSVEENKKDANVGEPVPASDSDSGDLRIYTISDTTNFKVDNNGQIQTKKALDFESQSSYSVTLTATDPSGASDSITVNITVTDTDDGAVISVNGAVNYAEGGTGPVATFTATDADGDAIVWSLGGPDADLFTIEGGVLAFKSSPDYESAKDQGSDNTYNVTVQASGGSTDVAVTVTNVDEMGSVSLSDLQPQGGESLTATVTDDDADSLDQERWQWSKSMAEDGEWSDISGATSPAYTPKTGDIGYFLRATASYSDGLGTGRDSASGVTAFAVEERPVSNAQPAFEDTGDADGTQQSRSVRETAEVGDSVGNAVTASDADNDPLLYTLSDSTAQSTADDDSDADTDSARDGDSTRFKIDRKTGQITTAETMPDQDTDGTASSYVVTVTATDPSGSMNTVEVTITIVDVDEAPEISLADTGLDTAFTLTRTGDEFVVTTPEEVALALTGEEDDPNTFATLLPVFDATDPEEEGSSPNVDKITWSISGPDVKRFEIAKVVGTDGTTSAPNSPANSSAALRWSSSDKSGPSYEDQDSADGDNVYEVTVTAFDGTSSKSQPVSVTVNNVEEIGAVSLTQLVPQTGIAVTAKLNDPDGGVTGASWQWYRGGTKADTTTATAADDDADIAGAVTIDPATINPCADTNTDAICSIPDATSSTYTPTDDDDGNLLTAWVTYTDALGDETNTARATSESNARERRDANAAPSFGDDESVERSVEENKKDANVGEPVPASDSDSGDLRIYTISDTTNFKVDNNGQIQTKKALDFESQSSYSVTLTATDPSGASDSITVNITVTDTDDGATIQISTENSAPAFDGESVTLSVDENAEAGTAVGDPIVATDKDGQDITYSLDDSSVVEIWPSGQLTVAEGANLDYEGDANSYTVVITASDGVDSASIMVTINVNNVGLDSPYDVDDNGSISKDEAVTAVDDYFLDNITREEVNAVLAIYFG